MTAARATEPAPMSTTLHDEYLADRAAMLAMRAMIALQPAVDLGPLGRPAFDALMERTPAADGVVYEPATLGGVAGWWCRPTGAKVGAAILYLHGGAYVVGSAKAYRHFGGQIAARAAAPVFVADYGLAPERPFPAAVEDAGAAYRALAATGASRLAIAGDSAGGGLALVLASGMALAANDGVVPRPVATIALSPWTDLALTGESVTARADRDPLLTAAALHAAKERYLGQHDPRDPQASPLWGHHAGLPPTMLHVGEDEILLDDARRYAERLAAAGSLGELHVWKGMVHVFPANLGLLRAAREATDAIGLFLRRHLAGTAPMSSTAG
jgi:monoterpene epsilon-lactone hydrolase